MQCRRGYVSPDTKLLFKCAETSGIIRDSVAGVGYDPSSVGDGSTAFNNPYSVRLTNDSGAARTPLEHNLTFNTRKVILLAAVVNQKGSGTRVNLGVSDGGSNRNVFSISLFTNMHQTFMIDDVDYDSSTPINELLANDTPHVIYLLWNGLGSTPSIAGTLSSKALNMDGSVYTPVVTPFSLSDNTVLIPNETFTPDNYSRLNGADYYSVFAKEIDYLPDDLDYKLAQWGSQALLGYKGAPRL
jgi:hypothetical protein